MLHRAIAFGFFPCRGARWRPLRLKTVNHPFRRRLSMFIALGNADREPTMTLSTYPWREGGPLFPDAVTRFDTAGATLEIAGAETKQIWRLMETDLPPSELATLFSGAG